MRVHRARKTNQGRTSHAMRVCLCGWPACCRQTAPDDAHRTEAHTNRRRAYKRHIGHGSGGAPL